MSTARSFLLLAGVFVGCHAASEQVEKTERSLTVSPSAVYRIQSLATGKCIGIVGNSKTNSAKVEIRTLDLPRFCGQER